MQQRQDNPLEYFFSFDASSVQELQEGEHQTFVKEGWNLKQSGINDQMKVEVFAMGANSILMRVENIADVFDSNGEVIYQEVNVLALATQLFETANNHEAYKFGVSIEEVSLTANQSYEAMANRRLKWKTVDD